MLFDCMGVDRANNKEATHVELGYHNEQGKAFYYISVGETHVVLTEEDSKKLLKQFEDYSHRISQ